MNELLEQRIPEILIAVKYVPKTNDEVAVAMEFTRLENRIAESAEVGIVTVHSDLAIASSAYMLAGRSLYCKKYTAYPHWALFYNEEPFGFNNISELIEYIKSFD